MSDEERPVADADGTVPAITGKNALIDSSGMRVRDGEVVLASFGADAVDLGANSDTSVITMCGKRGKIAYDNFAVFEDGLSFASTSGVAIASTSTAEQLSDQDPRILLSWRDESLTIRNGTQNMISMYRTGTAEDPNPQIDINSAAGSININVTRINLTKPGGSANGTVDMDEFSRVWNGPSASVRESQTWPDVIVTATARGRAVTVQVDREGVAGLATTTSGDSVVGKVAEGYRPHADVWQMIGVSGSAWLLMVVRKNGNVCITHRYGASSTQWAVFHGSVCYVAA